MRTFYVVISYGEEPIKVEAACFEIADIGRGTLIFKNEEAFVAAFADWHSVQEVKPAA